MLAGLRGDRPVRDVCREYEISETLYYQWRDRLLEGGKSALVTPRDKALAQAMRSNYARPRSESRSSSGLLAARPMSWRSPGELFRDWT